MIKNSNVSLEEFYKKLYKSIRYIAAYLEDKQLIFLIKGCRMKPCSIMYDSFNYKRKLHMNWFDEFGSSIEVRKNKSVCAKLNDLTLDRSKIINTDLYSNLNIKEIARMSKFVFLAVGKDDIGNGCHWIIFLGKDNYFRTYMYLEGEWMKASTLNLGVKTIKRIILYAGKNKTLRFIIDKDIAGPCQIEESWLSCWPPKDDLIAEMSSEGKEILRNLL